MEPFSHRLDKLLHQGIKHRTFMVITRNHLHGHKKKEIQRWVRVKQGHHLITPPPLTGALLSVAHLAVVLFRNGMVMLIKEKLDRSLIVGVVRNKEVGSISYKMKPPNIFSRGSRGKPRSRSNSDLWQGHVGWPDSAPVGFATV